MTKDVWITILKVISYVITALLGYLTNNVLL